MPTAEDKLDRLEQRITDILVAVANLTGEVKLANGTFAETERRSLENERRIRQLEAFQNRAIGAAVALGALSGSVAGAIAAAISAAVRGG